MQKKLIVLAIAGLVSTSAFADVGLYGVVDGALASVTGTGTKGGMLAVSGGLAASRLGVKASEKLDNGMTAVLVVESGLDTQTNSPIGAADNATTIHVRQQLLGVAGDFGTVATGYLQTTGYDFATKFDPFADSSVSSLQNVTGSSFLLGATGAGARAQRAVAYISPDFNGVSFAVNYSTALAGGSLPYTVGGVPQAANTGLGDAATASTAASTNITATLASVSYAAGPLAVEAVYAVLGGQSNASEFGVGASYDVTVAKLFLTYQAHTSSTVGGATSVSTNAFALSGVIPAGPGALALGYAANSSPNSTGATGYTAAYLHPMSKTATAYAAYSGVTNASSGNGYSVDNGVYTGNNNLGANVLKAYNTTGGSTSSLIAVGLSKKF